MKRRRPLALALGLLLLVVLLLGGAWMIFVRHVYEPPVPPPVAAAPPHLPEPPAPPPEEPLAPEPEPEGAEVLSVQGEVERSAPEGAWTPVRQGDVLHSDEALRTSRTARADLGVGGKARLTVMEGSSLTVREVTRAVHRFRLTRGRVAADYGADGERVLRIEGEKGETAVEAQAARFSVVSAGTTLAVATETGRVNLRTAAGEVEVKAGEQAAASDGLAPSAPAPIAPEVLLRLAEAARAERDPCAAVQGKVSPGTVVTVDGEPAEVDRLGHFAVRRRRREPGNIRVVAVDVAGRTAERELRCLRPPEEQHSISDVKVRWGHARKR